MKRLLLLIFIVVGILAVVIIAFNFLNKSGPHQTSLHWKFDCNDTTFYLTTHQGPLFTFNYYDSTGNGQLYASGEYKYEQEKIVLYAGNRQDSITPYIIENTLYDFYSHAEAIVMEKTTDYFDAQEE
ncbi:MAG: hypothetical protein IPM74_16140 [Crocinitomicaceae bacterium]|nr:hypothetical protein [Crocinitomicaceae bacterium]MBK8927380.1 hypothetical protein [Crocinitomicaceae bacterium]